MKEIKYLFIHYTKSSKDTTTWEDVDKWHREKGWKMIGYNFFINGEGKGKIGRLDNMRGAHTRGCNPFSLGISIALDNYEYPSDKQINALINWLTEKCKIYNIPIENILGHRDAYIMKLADSATNTDCPGDILYNMLPSIRDRVKQNLDSNFNKLEKCNCETKCKECGCKYKDNPKNFIEIIIKIIEKLFRGVKW